MGGGGDQNVPSITEPFAALVASGSSCRFSGILCDCFTRLTQDCLSRLGKFVHISQYQSERDVLRILVVFGSRWFVQRHEQLRRLQLLLSSVILGVGSVAEVLVIARQQVALVSHLLCRFLFGSNVEG